MVECIENWNENSEIPLWWCITACHWIGLIEEMRRNLFSLVRMHVGRNHCRYVFSSLHCLLVSFWRRIVEIIDTLSLIGLLCCPLLGMPSPLPFCHFIWLNHEAAFHAVLIHFALYLFLSLCEGFVMALGSSKMVIYKFLTARPRHLMSLACLFPLDLGRMGAWLVCHTRDLG